MLLSRGVRYSAQTRSSPRIHIIRPLLLALGLQLHYAPHAAHAGSALHVGWVWVSLLHVKYNTCSACTSCSGTVPHAVPAPGSPGPEPCITWVQEWVACVVQSLTIQKRHWIKYAGGRGVQGRKEGKVGGSSACQIQHLFWLVWDLLHVAPAPNWLKSTPCAACALAEASTPGTRSVIQMGRVCGSHSVHGAGSLLFMQPVDWSHDTHLPCGARWVSHSCFKRM